MKFLKSLKNTIATRILKEGFVERYVQDQILRAYPESYRIDQFMKDDVFIVGYPKSGNTWMQNLVAGLIFGVYGENASGFLVQELVPDMHYKTHYQRFSDVTCFKSHFMPRPEYHRVIYIVRDGRDALVSFRHFQQAIEGKELDWLSVERRMEEKWGDWSTHVSRWLENPFNAEFLMIKYEDIKRTPSKELKKVSNFIGIDPSQEELEKIISSTSFNNLKDREKKTGFGNRNFPKNKSFFRRGVVGSYKDELPGDVLCNYEKKHVNMLKKLGYEI